MFVTQSFFNCNAVAQQSPGLSRSDYPGITDFDGFRNPDRVADKILLTIPT
jgi:hypothetical protein